MFTRHLTKPAPLRSALGGLAILAFGSTPAIAQTVEGVRTAVAVRPGSQTDPHISGTMISYTDSDGSSSAIHYYDLAMSGGNDTAIDPGAGIDQLAGIDGNRIVYTHIESATRAIHVYDVGTGLVTVIDPQPGSDRRNAAIGGNTVAWVDFNGTSSEVWVYDLAAATGPVQISFSAAQDTQPSVSPDGSRVAYTSCSGVSTGCDVILYDTASGTSTVLTGGATEDRNPDLSNDRVVYAETDAAGETDIVWVGLSGGASSGRFDAPDAQLNPSISGDLIAFEGLSADNGSFDIYVLDITNDELYRLTDTVLDETLNDVALGVDGRIRAVWSTNVDIGDNDVHAITFERRPPADPCAPQTPAQACADPTGRAQLAQVAVGRGHGLPPVAGALFAATAGTNGVACIANSGTRFGLVTVNLQLAASPGDFGTGVTSIAKSVQLRANNVLAAAIAGENGVSFTVKVFGPRAGCGKD
jgi:hypothetical protein